MRVRKTTCDISGFGRDGDYEACCQRMLWRGVAYLAEVQPPVSIWDQSRNYAYGVMHVEGTAIKALETAVMVGEDDVTGAQHQAVMNHLAYIHNHGVDGWLDAIRERRSDAVYEWEGEIGP